MGQERSRIDSDSGFRDLVGYAVAVAPRAAWVTLDVEPKHLNRSGVLHGGVLMTLFDAACGYACMAGHEDAEYPSLVTVTMNTNFLTAIDTGTLTVEARIVGGGRSTVFTEARALDGEGRLVATASGTFRRLRGRLSATAKLGG